MPGEADAFVGVVLGNRYKLLVHVNSGNFADVFEASDNTTNTNMAIKMLSPFRASVSADAVIEFETEGRLLNLLSAAKNVVDHEGTFTDNVQVEFPPRSGNLVQLSVQYHVLELADSSLDDLLAVRRDVDWSLRLNLFRQLVAGAHQMHLQKVVHRDMKASNCLLFGTTSRQPAAKLSDLGRSRDLTEQAQAIAATYLVGRGDASFAPPELLWLQGDPNDHVAFRRADLFLLGSVFYELATGQGITGLAVGNWRAVVQRAAAMTETERTRAFQAEIATLRGAFENALQLLTNELPPEIRYDGIALIRQLCDPEPHAREFRFSRERRLPPWGLEWLFRRIDILDRRLRVGNQRLSSVRAVATKGA